jgi:hypothetical protein
MDNMVYETELIDPDKCTDLRRKYLPQNLFSAKADIYGICIQLFTADRDHMDMWTDNFYAMSDHTRSHARIFSVNDPDMEMKVLYEQSSCTAFLFNFEYYGWIKSIALGIAGNILEEVHDVHSVHGAALSVDGTGVTLIAPPKTGKTTQSWGLLRAENTCLISDDWYFTTICKGRPLVHGSEKNCYIDADIGDVWAEYKPLINNVRFDSSGRGIANIRWVAGNTSVVPVSSMRYVMLMKRDAGDEKTIRRLTVDEAMCYMLDNDLCNPHQIVRSEHKTRIRTEFFRSYFSSCDLYMINTTGSPQETQDLIRSIVLN